MLQFLRGKKTYLGAGAILLFVLASMAGYDQVELQNQAQEIYLLVSSIVTIVGKIHKDIRSVDRDQL